MREILESTASRIVAEAQRIAVYVDPEVLSWPGGYIIAVSVYLYARAVAFRTRLHRATQRTDLAGK